MEKASLTKGRNHYWQSPSAKLSNCEEPKPQRPPGVEAVTSRVACWAARGGPAPNRNPSAVLTQQANQVLGRAESRVEADTRNKQPMGPMITENVKP